MGLETYFRIFAIDNTGKRTRTKEWIHNACKEELKHDCCGYAKKDEELEDLLKQEGLPPFVEIRKTPDADCLKYHYLPEQEEDPFPLWVDTASGKLAYEIMEENFLSDFDELYKYFRIDTTSHKCCEISVDDVQSMLAVLDYILKGKYDRDIEDAVFQDNDFFRLFEDQFFNFGMRFRRKTQKRGPQQTIRIIIKDERHDVEREELSDEDDEDDWQFEEERRESEKNERFVIQRLRDVLSAFLMLVPPEYIKNPKVTYKLGYFLSY